MSRDVYLDNVMRERWDDTTRTLTTYSAAGVLTSTRPFTAAEIITADTATAVGVATVNADVLRTRMANLLDVNATYLALAAPTNTDMLAQVRRLTRECNILMRLAGNWLDTTTGT